MITLALLLLCLAVYVLAIVLALLWAARRERRMARTWVDPIHCRHTWSGTVFPRIQPPYCVLCGIEAKDSEPEPSTWGRA